MLPVIAIVGRPNVGKSTLFNTLTQTRDAIVADVPGVTRDRQYGYGKLGRVPYVCIDTGGLTLETSENSRRRLEGKLNGGGPRVQLEGVNGGIKLSGR